MRPNGPVGEDFVAASSAFHHSEHTGLKDCATPVQSGALSQHDDGATTSSRTETEEWSRRLHIDSAVQLSRQRGPPLRSRRAGTSPWIFVAGARGGPAAPGSLGRMPAIALHHQSPFLCGPFARDCHGPPGGHSIGNGSSQTMLLQTGIRNARTADPASASVRPRIKDRLDE